MMQKNKIIDKLIKKLIVNNYDKKDIFNLVFKYKKFIKFDYYILYLYSLLSFVNNEVLEQQMAKSIQSYLEYLVSIYNLNFDVEDLQLNDLLNEFELSILGINNLNEANNFLFVTNDDKLCYILNKNFNFYNDQLLSINLDFNKINNDLLLSNNNIFIFKKIDYKYSFLGKFNIIDSSYNIDENFHQHPSLLISKNIKLDNEYKNLFLNNLNNKILDFKQNISLLNKNHIDLNFMNYQNCLVTLQNQLFFNAINDHDLFLKIINKFKTIYSEYLNIDNLIEDNAYLNSNQLIQITNDFNILIGYQFSIDYLNNIFLIVEHSNINNIYMIKIFNNDLELKINKIIFNSIKNKNIIYLFKKVDKKYLYLGKFKCTELILKDNVYYFKLIKLNFKQKLINLNYKNNLISDDSYKSIFDSILNIKSQDEVINQDVKILYENSIINKQKWITNQIIENVNNGTKYKELIILCNQYNLKIDLAIEKVLSFDFIWLIKSKIVTLYNLAFELNKNIDDKKLIEIKNNFNNEYNEENLNYLINLFNSSLK